MTDYPDHDQPTAKELARELGLPAPTAVTRRSLRQTYGGLRVDEMGYDAEGRHYESLDGGGQE